MRVWCVIGCLLVSSAIFAQEKSPQAVVLEGSYTLDQRFDLIKAKSQTYQDYKVIKESVLNGLWKITKDSIGKVKGDLNEAKARIAKLENDVLTIENTLKQKELAVAGITYDSTHISVLGIPFTKSAFLILTTLVVAGLVILLLVLLGTLRFTRSSLKERILTVDLLTKEYDEYKKKALDKETKILRQLQDERNRYHASPR
jgi:hypothetical protein